MSKENGVMVFELDSIRANLYEVSQVMPACRNMSGA